MSHYLDVCAYLRTHKDRFVPWRELHAYCGVSDRELRAIKLEALENGIPIASGDKGYRFATSFDDMREMIGRMSSQSYSMLKQIKLIKSIFGITEQLSLFNGSAL